MSHCFIHAPPKNGAMGILLYHEERMNGYFRDSDLEIICNSMFLSHDIRDLVIHANKSVTKLMIASYQLRRERNMMQRYSSEETFEDIHFDEWLRVLKHYYPHLANYAAFLLE